MSDAGRLEDARLGSDIRSAIAIPKCQIAHQSGMVAGEGHEETMLRRRLATTGCLADDARGELAPHDQDRPRVVGESDVLGLTPHGRPLQVLHRWRHTWLQWHQQATLPRWITPLSIGCLALSIMYNLDHFSTFSHPFPTLLITGALAVFLLMHYLALVRADQRQESAQKQLATLALIGLLAMNTVVHVAPVLPQVAQTHRYRLCRATVFTGPRPVSQHQDA